MVCFFEVAFDNGLLFPLHPFMKRVLQHFNICPSQLAPNGWGILVGLLGSFRDRGLDIPSLALFLHLFHPKEAVNLAERLNEECRGLRADLHQRVSLAAQRDEVIRQLRDQASA